MIHVRDVTFTYPGSAGSPAVSHVSLSVAPGEMVVMLGRNGSGKSTLARLLNGLLVPDSGSVTVDGLDTASDSDIWEIRRHIGLVFQNPDNQIVGTFVEEDVAFGPENLGIPRPELRRRVTKALDAVGLSGFERREPHLLSGGQKQRLAIAGALALEPAYLVFDEPTAMLDPYGREEVLGVLAKLRTGGTGIVHVTHHVADAADADRVLVLEGGGAAFDGGPDALFGDAGQVAELGLDLPPAGRLAHNLRAAGVPVPAVAMDADSVVNSLWPSS